MTSDKYQPYRHLAIEDRAMADMPAWIKTVNEYISRNNGQYLRQNNQSDYGRRNISS